MRLTTRFTANRSDTLSRQSDRIARVLTSAVDRRVPRPPGLPPLDVGSRPDLAQTAPDPDRDMASSSRHTVFVRGGD